MVEWCSPMRSASPSSPSCRTNDCRISSDEVYDTSAKALEHCHVLCLSRNDFLDAVSEYPEFAVATIQSLASIIVEQTRKLEEFERRLAADPGPAAADDRRG